MSQKVNNHKEKERLEALYSYEIIDTEPEQVFDEMTSLAAQICHVPISLITLLDDTRQWFKSRLGLDIKETPREVSFCNYAIEHDLLMEVEDTTKDERFRDNPLVVNDPKIRFYAGYPLINTEGHALGTLCVIDKKPRRLDEEQRKSLKTLSKLVIACLESKRRQRVIESALEVRQEFYEEMSFEMRTPLNAILGLTQILADNNACENSREDFKLLKESADKLNHILNELLDSRAFHKHNYINENIKFDQQVLISSLKENMEKRFPNAVIKVANDMSIPRWISGNPYKLKELLRHCMSVFLLESNYIYITSELLENSEGKCVVKYDMKRGHLVSGTVDAKVVMKRNLEQHLALQLAPSFTEDFSLTDESMSVRVSFNYSDDSPYRRAQQPVRNIDLSGLNILLVEDLDTNRRIAGKFLSIWDTSHEVALNGRQAMEMVKANEYDVVLMDLRMPVMDGYEATREIKQMDHGRYEELPIIALTASVSGAFEDKIKGCDFADFITKPFNPNELKMKIAQATGRSLAT